MCTREVWKRRVKASYSELLICTDAFDILYLKPKFRNIIVLQIYTTLHDQCVETVVECMRINVFRIVFCNDAIRRAQKDARGSSSQHYCLRLSNDIN